VSQHYEGTSPAHYASLPSVGKGEAASRKPGERRPRSMLSPTKRLRRSEAQKLADAAPADSYFESSGVRPPPGRARPALASDVGGGPAAGQGAGGDAQVREPKAVLGPGGKRRTRGLSEAEKLIASAPKATYFDGERGQHAGSPTRWRGGRKRPAAAAGLGDPE